jgi:hypothetical protein
MGERATSGDAARRVLLLISFLDRVFLKLFGYSGEYFDWRDFPHHQAKTRTLPPRTVSQSSPRVASTFAPSSGDGFSGFTPPCTESS